MYLMGQVPMDESILDIEDTGYLPSMKFLDPLAIGEVYYNKVFNWLALPTMFDQRSNCDTNIVMERIYRIGREV